MEQAINSPISLRQVLCVSHSAGLLNPAELRSLLRQVRRTAEDMELTGRLMHQGGTVLQFIEAPIPAMRTVLERLVADRRHRHVTLLRDRYIRTRHFSDWSVAISGSALDGPLESRLGQLLQRATSCEEWLLEREAVWDFFEGLGPNPCVEAGPARV